MNQTESDKEKKEVLVCPVCGERLMFMMPSGQTLYCKKCKKYFVNDNGKVGKETTYPYVDKNADY